MDTSAFSTATAVIASVSVVAILAAGATTFLPRIGKATVKWARSLLG